MQARTAILILGMVLLYLAAALAQGRQAESGWDMAAAAGSPVQLAPPAARRLRCAPRAVVVERLAERRGERRASLMLDARGNLVEIFANRDTGSWTLIVTGPGGPTCVMASGESFQAEKPLEPSDSSFLLHQPAGQAVRRAV